MSVVQIVRRTRVRCSELAPSRRRSSGPPETLNVRMTRPASVRPETYGVECIGCFHWSMREFGVPPRDCWRTVSPPTQRRADRFILGYWLQRAIPVLSPPSKLRVHSAHPSSMRTRAADRLLLGAKDAALAVTACLWDASSRKGWRKGTGGRCNGAPAGRQGLPPRLEVSGFMSAGYRVYHQVAGARGTGNKTEASRKRSRTRGAARLPTQLQLLQHAIGRGRSVPRSPQALK